MTRDELRRRMIRYGAHLAGRQQHWTTDVDRAAEVMWLRMSGWTYAQIGCRTGMSTTGASNLITRWSHRLGIPRPTGERIVDGPDPPRNVVADTPPKPVRAPDLVSLARTLARIELQGGQVYGRPAAVCRALGTRDVPRMRHVLHHLRERHAVAFAELHGSDGDPRWQVTARVRL